MHSNPEMICNFDMIMSAKDSREMLKVLFPTWDQVNISDSKRE